MDQDGNATVTKGDLALYFALTIPLAWLFWIPLILLNRGEPTVSLPAFVLSTLGAISPLVALGIVERVSQGRVRLAAILKNIRLREWRSPWVLAAPLYIVGIHLVLTLAYFGIETAGGGDSGPLRIFKPEVFATLGWWILAVIPLHFFPALLSSPLFEEPGWRGFAFENLQRFLLRDAASLVVGSYWWLWHQGMNMAFGLMPSPYGYASMLLDSVAIDALHTLSRRNVFAAMLAHQAMGTVFIFLFPLPALWYLLLIKLAAVAALRYQVHRQS